MDDISEEDMKKMDEALANVFRQLSRKKGQGLKKKERKDKLAVVHFKIRVLDLINVYLSHQPSLEHILIIINFVRDTLERIFGKNKDNKPFENRLIATLKKITNLKKTQKYRIDEDFDGDSIVETLKSFTSMANNSSPIMTSLNNPQPIFSQVCSLLVKSSLTLGDKSLNRKVNQVFEEAMDDFFQKGLVIKLLISMRIYLITIYFTSSQCMLPVTFFLQPMLTNWKGSWQLMNKLCKYTFDQKIRQFRRNQGATLLATLFKNANLLSDPPKDISDKVNALLTQVAKEFNSIETNSFKPRYVTELLALLHAIHSTDISKINWNEIKVSLEDIREKVPTNMNFSYVKPAYNKIAVDLGVTLLQANDKQR